MITDKFLERGRKIDPEYVKYITDEAYTVKQAIDMELDILMSIGFELYIATPNYFFDIYKGLIPLTDEQINKSEFLLEFANFNYLESYEPSTIALAAILCSKDIDYSKLSEDNKSFLSLDKDSIKLLNKYIINLREFYTTKFKGDYKESIQNLFE